MSDSEKESVKKGIKDGLEGLKGKIPGLIDIKVNTEGRLASSTADLMLDSTFENAEALKGSSGACGCGRQQGSPLHSKPFLP